jgi:DNA-binding winged helix-turn-helix (wHTH) protein/tetratricopeptide (TPR) repeat protein
MPHNNSYYEFGPFQLNIRQRVLVRAGEVISLSPKTMDLLFVLVRRAGELVKKDELMAELWPDSFVEEGNLSQNVFTIRKALGDQRSDAQFVETVARHGYRFIAPVKLKDDINDNPEGQGQSVTLAVLPFVNDTADDQLEYLADGIGENIIKSLSQLSTLRVMSRISTGRFKGKQIDLKDLAAELRVNSLLFGRLTARNSQLAVAVELVDTVNGWLLWSDNFDFSVKDILTIQDEIVKQIMVTLGLQLSRDEEKTVTTRYTESSLAYEAYLEGRFFWSRFTLPDIEKAISHFRRSIDLDPNYALAYSACIDCYLRVVTNYVPPEAGAQSAPQKSLQPDSTTAFSNSEHKLRLRHEWDWKGAERELRRAQALKSDYPDAHQWHAAYMFVQKLYEEHRGESWTTNDANENLAIQFRFASLTASEEVGVFCAIGREQIVVGNYAAARLVLDRWLPKTGWPQLDHLDPHSAADLLFTLGNLSGVLSFSDGGKRGFKRAESYLSGAIALAEQLGAEVLAAEARIELARCYYRKGLYEESRELLDHVLGDLPANKNELRSLCLAVYGCVERDSGKLSDSLARLQEANTCETGQLVTGFRELQLATTLKELAILGPGDELFVEAGHHFRKALYEFEAIGNHTQTAATENNFGYLLLSMSMFAQAEEHLLHALTLFTKFANDLCTAQVNETLAQLYLATSELTRALAHANQAVAILEITNGDAVLAEALHTKGLIGSRLKRFSEARSCFEGSYRVAERCGDSNGAGRALLSLDRELSEQLAVQERSEIRLRLSALKLRIPPGALLNRIEQTLAKI